MPDLTEADDRRESEPMRTTAYRHQAVVGLAVAALITVGCSNGRSVDASAPPQVGLIATSETETPPAEVTLIGERDVEVTLTGPIAAKYASATEYQRQALGKPLTDWPAAVLPGGPLRPAWLQFRRDTITRLVMHHDR